MPPKKRPLEEESPGVETRSSKSRRKSNEQASNAEATPSKVTKQTEKKKEQGAKKSKASPKAKETVKKTKSATQKQKGKAKGKAKKKGGKENRAPTGGQYMTLGPGEYIDSDGEIRKEGEEREPGSEGSGQSITLGPGEFLNSDGEIEREGETESETMGPRESEPEPSLDSDKVQIMMKHSEDLLTKLFKAPMDKEDPYEYILMTRPPYDLEEENKTKPLGNRLTEEELEQLWEQESNEIPHDTLASTKPDHKWVIMRGAWIRFADRMRERTYRSPDSMDMYIYNDFEGYGLLEMIETHVSRPSPALVTDIIPSLSQRRLTAMTSRYKILRPSMQRRTRI